MAALFGPFYPAPLQFTMNHAERFVDALRRIGRELVGSRWADPLDPTDAERWLHGRTEEIETFVADVVREWHTGLISADVATGILNGYLVDVHKGFTQAFGKSSPGCCEQPIPKTLASNEFKTAVPSRTRAGWMRLLTFSKRQPVTPTPSTPRSF
jgi:hypothetical protein